MLLKSRSGQVPPSTRSIQVKIYMDHLVGDEIDAYADNISVVLHGPSGSDQPPAGGGLVFNAIDGDPDNHLWYCDTARAALGTGGYDQTRCMSFRYQVPAEGIQSAVLHLDVEVLDASTDALLVAVDQPSNCNAWGGNGGMVGCVYVLGSPFPSGPLLDVDLLNIQANSNAGNTPESQQLVLNELIGGVLHVAVQDDTIVHCAQLVLNGGDGRTLCDRNNPSGGAPPSGTDPPPAGSNPPATLALGNYWDACETYSGTICGIWTRDGTSNTWYASWSNGATATLIITQNGNQVTVERSDPNGLLAAYVGTLNADGNYVSGTVTWCCDGFGTRSGTWDAAISYVAP